MEPGFKDDTFAYGFVSGLLAKVFNMRPCPSSWHLLLKKAGLFFLALLFVVATRAFILLLLSCFVDEHVKQMGAASPNYFVGVQDSNNYFWTSDPPGQLLFGTPINLFRKCRACPDDQRAVLSAQPKSNHQRDGLYAHTHAVVNARIPTTRVMPIRKILNLITRQLDV